MLSTEFCVISRLEDLPAPSAAVMQFIEAWKSVRGGNLLPRKQDFDPLSIARLLPDVWIYGYHPEEDVFRCRLAGENVNKAWGHSIAGKGSEEILGVQANVHITAIWKRVLEAPLLHYTKLEHMSENTLYAAERTVVPLSDAAGGRNYVLGLSLYTLSGFRRITPPKIPRTAYQIYCRDL